MVMDIPQAESKVLKQEKSNVLKLVEHEAIETTRAI